MVTDNAPEHPWTTPGPLLYTKSWHRSAKVDQSGSRWSTVVQSGPGSTRRQNQLFNFFADVVPNHIIPTPLYSTTPIPGQFMAFEPLPLVPHVPPTKQLLNPVPLPLSPALSTHKP